MSLSELNNSNDSMRKLINKIYILLEINDTVSFDSLTQLGPYNDVCMAILQLEIWYEIIQLPKKFFTIKE